MWQRHTTVVNKPARSTEDNGEDLSGTRWKAGYRQEAGCDSGPREEMIKANGQLKSVDPDGAPGYKDLITERSLRELFCFQGYCQKSLELVI